MEIKNAHIFNAGRHKGSGPGGTRDWSESDLDSMVSAFNALQQAGRVPLKFGHNDTQPLTDGQPALGWIGKLWREGKKLMADLVDVPNAVYSMIQKGLYKFTSVEILRNAEHEGKKFPFVVDAIALLGADPPAVSNLGDLQRLTLKRAAFTFAESYAFTRKFRVPAVTEPEPQPDPELARLRAENARLTQERDEFQRRQNVQAQQDHQRTILSELEAAVKAGKLTPASRDELIRVEGLDDAAKCATFTRERLTLFTRIRERGDSTLMQRLGSARSAFGRDPNAATADDGSVASLTSAAVAKRCFARAAAEKTDVFDALVREIQMDPVLGQQILQATFD
jgi:hypothetical protein